MQLAGPQCRELKVKDAERYHFRPRELLAKLMQVYVNMWGQPEFVRAVTQDARAFKPAVLKRAATLTSNSTFLHHLEEAILKQADSSLNNKEDDVDVPEEFLDQLMFTVMEDPVMLPSSRAVVDRGTIVAHLLNNETDPFNRASLKLTELIDLPDLKKRIQEYQSQINK